MIQRRETFKVMVGGVRIGGGAPVTIQSMTNTRTVDINATVAQILRLEKAGCQIVRCAIPSNAAACAISKIKNDIHIPLVADIHFDYRLAIAAIQNGADKIRINPGNIGGKDRVFKVVECAKSRNVPIRIGVNSGSLEKDILKKYGMATGQALAESAIRNITMIEDMGYDNLVISIKSSDVPQAITAHEIVSERTRHPIHVGITESGTVRSGTIVSSVGIGAILSRGIGDTIRVSLTGDPVNEIFVAKKILQSLGLKKSGVRVISCPTCGRTNIDLERLAQKTEELTADCPFDISVAVMGCVVNGPGEAAQADLGIAGGNGEGLLFSKGKIIKKVPEDGLLPALMEEINKLGMEGF